METELLTDPKELRKDLGLVSQAVRRFGSRLQEVGPELVDRLAAIVKKTTVSTLTKDGDFVEVEALADDNAIRAAEVLLKAVQIAQKDDHHADKMAAPKAAPNIAIQVNNGGAIGETPGAGRSRASEILERVRLARIPQADPG
jgi:hypothetical protein